MFLAKRFSIDARLGSSNNHSMSIDTTLPVEVRRDLELLCASAAAGRPVDPAVAQRVHERAESVLRELRSKAPTQIAVELIREARDP